MKKIRKRDFKVKKKLFVIITFPLMLIGCDTECSNDIIKTRISPDGKYKAIAYIRDCGATTDFSPQVSLILKKYKLKENNLGNIFVGDHSKFIDIYWKSKNTLVIVHNCEIEYIFKSEKSKFGINIEYEMKTKRKT